jgi:hypothetical protein
MATKMYYVVGNNLINSLFTRNIWAIVKRVLSVVPICKYTLGNVNNFHWAKKGMGVGKSARIVVQ